MRKRLSGIYVIVNTQTGDEYIGSSVDIHSRLRSHISLLRSGKHHAQKLQDAWDQYGEISFDTDILELVDDIHQLIRIEQNYLDQRMPSYNVAKIALSPITPHALDPEREAARQQREQEKKRVYDEIMETWRKWNEYVKNTPMEEQMLDDIIRRKGIDRVVSARQRVEALEMYLSLARGWYLLGIPYDQQMALFERMFKGTFGINTQEHKHIKGDVEDLVRNLTSMESALLTLAVGVILALHAERASYGIDEIARDVDDGAALARENRLKLEQLTGKPVVSSRNMLKSPDGGIFGDLDAPDEEI